MSIIREYLKLIANPNPNLFTVCSMEDIVMAMGDRNFLDSKLLNNSYGNVRKPLNLCINEFGHKFRGKTYGTEHQELIEIFLMKRYEIFQDYNKLTHVTMNAGTDDLKDIFSPRVIDRLREMFNIIELGGESFRK